MWSDCWLDLRPTAVYSQDVKNNNLDTFFLIFIIVMEALAAFLGRISSYNLLNNLIPGAIFCVLLKTFVGYDFISVEIIELLIVFYFSGMVIGRIGSLIIEPVLRTMKVIDNRDHKLYVAAEQKDEKISSISETNNIYRSIITVVFITIIVKLFRIVTTMQWDFGNILEWLLLLALLFLFVLAYRKQTKYLVSRIDYHTK